MASGILDSHFSPAIGSSGRVFSAIRQPDGKLLIGGRFANVNGHGMFNITRLLDNGLRDTSFEPPLQLDPITELAIQPDGKILMATMTKVIRLNADGSLDPTFVSGQGLSGGAIGALLVLSDGDILLGGEFGGYNGLLRHGLVRLNSDGSVDHAFTTQTSSFSSTVNSLAQAPDGKIYVGGRFTEIGGVSRSALARLHPNGDVDQSFNTTLSQTINELVLTADGKIYVGGRFNTPDLAHVARLDARTGMLDTSFVADGLVNTWVHGIGLHPDGRILVFGPFPGTNARPVYLLNANGTIDHTFGVHSPKGPMEVTEVLPRSDGGLDVIGSFENINGLDRCSLARLTQTYTVDESYRPFLIGRTPLSVDIILALERQSDGKVIIGGNFTQIDRRAQSFIGRLNPDGSVDPAFNPGDLLLGTGGDSVRAIALQPDGRIMIAGGFDYINGLPSASVARLNPDGTHDPSFRLSGSEVHLHSVAVQPDGKILIGGQFTEISGVPRKYLARLNSDGTLDGSFDVGTLINSGNPTEIIVQPDGKILVSGVRNTSDNQWSTIVRLNSDGTRDTSFNAVLSFGNPDIELEADGKIAVGGAFSSVNGQPRSGLARLNADGSLDTSFVAQVSVVGGSGVTAIRRLPNGQYVVAGPFVAVNGVARPGAARLNSDGTLDQDMFVGHSHQGGIRKVFPVGGGKIILTGGFYIFDNRPRLSIVQMRTSSAAPFDFDGDGKTDLSIFRPNGAEWWINRSSNGSTFAAQFGATTDRITPADFTGDGKADIAFFRPSSGEWYILRSEDFSFFAFPFGTNGDVPASADYDGDGTTDAAVYRPSNNAWFVRRSSGGTMIETFGSAGDVPVVADYDGDGKADIAIYRPSLGQWWVKRSGSSVIAFTFGESTDKPVQGDYTGDGKSDVAFWQPSTGQWFILRSEDFSFYAVPFGTTGDVPSPGDYDGDGKFDTAVFRPSNMNWYVDRSTAGVLIQQFGVPGDVPVPNAYVP